MAQHSKVFQATTNEQSYLPCVKIGSEKTFWLHELGSKNKINSLRCGPLWITFCAEIFSDKKFSFLNQKSFDLKILIGFDTMEIRLI